MFIFIFCKILSSIYYLPFLVNQCPCACFAFRVIMEPTSFQVKPVEFTGLAARSLQQGFTQNNSDGVCIDGSLSCLQRQLSSPT